MDTLSSRGSILATRCPTPGSHLAPGCAAPSQRSTTYRRTVKAAGSAAPLRAPAVALQSAVAPPQPSSRRNTPAAPRPPTLSRTARRLGLPPPAYNHHQHKRLVVAAAAAAMAEGGNDREASAASPAPATGLLSVFHVFTDERCNAKLLALAVGQALCSVATLIHDSYLPVYVQEELGLSNTKIGAVQGAAQFLCQLSKGVSGVAGDVLGSQTRVLVFGTALTLACKPMFAALSTVYGVFGVTACLYWFFFAKLLDRLSKGIREAPTKAVMNELARESGDAPDAAYGLRQSLATAGMLVGSTVASLTFAATGQNYVLTFAVAAIPPAVALAWLAARFRPPPPRPPPPPPPPAVSLPPTPSASMASSASIMSVDAPPGGSANGNANGNGVADVALSPMEKAVAIVKAFQPAYWQALAVVAVLYFARFDASFVALQAKAVLPKSLLPMLTLINMLVQTLLTAPLSRVSGTGCGARNRLLLAGFGCMVLADVCLGLPALKSPAGMFAGSAFIGLHMAFTHAITISMISSYMPTGVIPGVGKLSGTAVSFTDLLLGFVLAASNTLAGVLSDMTRAAGYGNVGCFAGGAVACVLSGLLLAAFERWGDLGRDELVARRRKAKAA